MKKLSLLNLALLLLIGSRSAFAFVTAVVQNISLQNIPMSIETTATDLKNMYTFEYDSRTLGETPLTYIAKGNPYGYYSAGGEFKYGSQYFKAELSSYFKSGPTIRYQNRTYYKYNSSEIDMYVSIKQGVYENNSDTYVYHYIPFTDVSNNGKAVFTKLKKEEGCYYDQDKSTWGITGTCDINGITITQNDGPAARLSTLYVYFPKKPTHPVTLNNVPVADIYVGAQLADSQDKPYDYRVFRKYTLSGTITFPNNCRTSLASQDVDLNSINPAQFTSKSKGELPQNYTAKEVTLTFTCDNNIGSSYGGMNWHLEATGPSVNNESVNGILKATATSGTINNLGVGLSSNQAGTTKIDATGATDYPAAVSGKVATAKFYAFPTMINSNKPTGGGDYKATATVRFDIP
ncbi:fimbrial protein [Enterobacter ludwigii]